MASTDKLSSANPLLGLNTQADPSVLKPEETTYALNGYPKNPFYSNYNGNELYFDLIAHNKPGYCIIYHLHLNKQDIVYWLVNPSLIDAQGRCASEIAIINDKKEYRTVLNNYSLNFSILFQPQGEYKSNVLGERVIYWCEKEHNPMRYLNVDIPYDNTFDINITNIFRNYNIPDINIVGVITNGALQAGSYQFSIQYADINGNEVTPFIPSTNPIPIYRDNITDNYDVINGDEGGTPTGKAISINISNLDQTFQYYNLVVTRTIKGIQTAIIVATLPISQSNYVYTGVETGIRDISLSELTLKRVVYKSAGTVTQSNGYLLWGDLKGVQDFNFQPYFVNIQVQWETKKVSYKDNNNNLKRPKTTERNKSYMRDEVYPLGLVFDLINGTTSPVIHLPARKLNKSSDGNTITRTTDQYGSAVPSGSWDTQIINNNDLYTGEAPKERWKVYNTGYKIGSTATGEYGEMSYWESDINTYPNKPEIWGALAGQPIRHHKFPDSSITHIHNGQNITNLNIDSVPELNYIGIRLPNIQTLINLLPADVKANIQGWRIVRGDRTYAKSVVAKGIVSNVWQKNFSQNNIGGLVDNRYYQNYPMNDLNADPYIAQNENGRYDSNDDSFFKAVSGNHRSYFRDRFTFFSPDTSFNKNFLAGNELKVETEEIGEATTWFNINGELGRFIRLPGAGGNNVNRVWAQYNVEVKLSGYVVPRVGEIRRSLNEATYLPYGQEVQTNTGGLFHNNFRESAVFLKIEKPIADPTRVDNTRRFLNERAKDSVRIIEAGYARREAKTSSFYYTSIKSGISGQYGNIFNIKYIDTGYTDSNYNNSVIFGGDIFITYQAIKRQFPFFGSYLNQFINTGDNKDEMDLRNYRVIPDIKFFYWWGGGDNSEGYYGYGHEAFGGDYMGYILWGVSGVTGYFVESEVNTELRNEGDDNLDTYFPNLKNKTVPLELFLGLENSNRDNYYSYNNDYSVQNKLYLFDGISPNYDPDQLNLNDYFNKVIYSQRAVSEDFYDNWLVYKSSDYYDFPKSKGRLIDMRYIGQYRILFRFEDTLYMHQLYGTLSVSEAEILLGSGKLFDKDPAEMSYSEVGSIGTRSQWAFNSNKSGQFMIDDIRGKIYHYTNTISDITITGMQDWFSENLPLNLVREFNIKADNPANPLGIGFISTYDHVNDLWILTKRDYSVINKELITSGKLIYDGKSFKLNGALIDFSNTSVFANKSWTMSYSVLNGRWYSYHSFIPSYYINNKLDYYSGINTPLGTSIWNHLSENYSTYYGKTYPYIIEVVLNTEGLMSFKTSSLSYLSKAYYKREEEVYENKNITFNKAVVYNDEQCSGILELVIKDENDLSSLFTTPATLSSSKQINLRKRDNVFNFSEFYDIVQDRDIQASFFTNSPVDNNYISQFPIDKVIKNSTLNYQKNWKELKNFRGKYIKLRLICENNNLHNIITNFIIEKERTSVR